MSNYASRGSASKKSGGAAAATVFGAIAAVFAAIGRGIAAAAKAIAHNKVGRIVAAVVIVIAIIGIADTAANWDKAYSGVKVGTVDVSGMTKEQAAEAISAAYEPQLLQTTAMIFANEEARSYLNDEIAQAEDKAQAEQISVEEARNDNKLWTATKTSVGATLPADDLAQAALEVGRENGGIIARLGTLVFGTTVDVTLDYDDELINSLGNEIDLTLGDKRIDADIEVVNGVASVVDPHDGMMVNRETLKTKLTEIFTKTNADGYFIATVESAPSRISTSEAQKVADAVNQAIRYGAKFTYKNTQWSADAARLGTWVITCVIPTDNGYKLSVGFDIETAKKDLMNNISTAQENGSVKVAFNKNGDNIEVTTSGDTQAPDVTGAAVSLNTTLFIDDAGLAWSASAPTSATEVAVSETDVPQTLSLEDAQSMGLVAVIGTYTTEYSTYDGTENRNYNIHRAADLLNNSIVKASGGEWSFNDIAGFCNEEAGFKSAGIILDGEYTDSIGGGICQVATTVFNAVFESGLPVVQRSNHSLYIASYPEGRDAAVSYPDLDLIWENDQESDVLVLTSHTDSTVTVTLLGAPTGYTVESITGEWEEGEAYDVQQKVDESYASGVAIVTTVGVDGSSISVTRIVRDKNGEEVRRDVFSSFYDPKDEVVTTGPDTEIDLDKYKSDLAD